MWRGGLKRQNEWRSLAHVMRSKINEFSFHSDFKTAEPMIDGQMASERTLAVLSEAHGEMYQTDTHCVCLEQH